MADEKELQVKIRFISDTTGVKDSQKATENIKEGNKKTGEGASEAEGKVKGLGKALDNLGKISAAMAVASGLAMREMGQAINAYVQNVGSTEAASKRWMLASQSNEMSMTRVGRSITEAALPYMEKYSQFLDNTATFMEQHPDIVKTGVDAVGVATGLAAIGGAIKIGSVVGKGVQGMLGASGGMAAAATEGAVVDGAVVGAPIAAKVATTSVIGGVLGTVLSVAGGVGLGLLANEALANSDFGKKLGIQNLGKIGTVASYLINRAGGQSHQEAAYNAAVYGQSIGAVPGGPNNNALGGNLPNQIIAYAQYYRQEENALRAHLVSMARAARDYQRQVEYEAEDYSRQKSRSVRDFNRQEAMTEFDYQRQRAIAVRDFGIQMTRSEQDYQKSRKRAGEDFQFQLWDIARSGDAFAYMQATRQFDLQQSRNEEDYNIQRQRQVEDFTRQQSDQSDAYNIQRAFRLQSFQISQDDAQVDFDIRRAREAEQRKLQIQDQQYDYNEQARIRRQAIADTLNDMSDSTTKASYLFAGMSSDMISDMQSLADAANTLKGYFQDLTPPNVPGRASGGYVNDGIYRMHNDEFVLNRDTSKTLERLQGSSLTQNSILALLGRGSGGSGSLTINDNRKFDSRLSADDRQAIRRENLNNWQEMLNA